MDKLPREIVIANAITAYNQDEQYQRSGGKAASYVVGALHGAHADCTTLSDKERGHIAMATAGHNTRTLTICVATREYQADPRLQEVTGLRNYVDMKLNDNECSRLNRDEKPVLVAAKNRLYRNAKKLQR